MYVREMSAVCIRLNAMLREACKDTALADKRRQDIAWEIVRARDAVAQTTAALLEIAMRP